MGEHYDQREHSTKREVDDLTDYQKLNSLDGAGIAANPAEIPQANPSREDDDAPISKKPYTGVPEVKVYDCNYNDGIDFSTVDDEGKTNI